MAWWIWVLVTGPAGSRLSLASGHKQAQVSLCRVNVKALGYVPQRVGRERESPFDLGERLSFPAQNQVVVSFVTAARGNGNAEAGLARRGQPSAALPYRLHAFFIDSTTGKVRGTREWPTSSKWSWVARAPKGQFVVITPEGLMLYSPGMQEIKHLDLPITKESIKDAWSIRPSPGGTYLALEYEPEAEERQAGEAVLRRELVDTENLRVIRQWTVKGGGGAPISISDNGTTHIYYKIGRLNEPQRILCYPYATYCGGSLISNHAILAVSMPEKGVASIGLMSTSGNLFFQQSFRRGEIVRRSATSANGERFAISLNRGKGGITALDIAPHYSLSRIMIYGAAAHGWIDSLCGKKQGIKSISGLALSPDGSLLALINQDGILEVYRVTSTPTPPQ